MTISAKVICHSRWEGSPDLFTLQLEYPRFIHSEFMTHRMFSRNASSSRAVPVITALKRIVKDPAMPIFWGKNKPGMQASEEVGSFKKKLSKGLWKASMYTSVAYAYLLHKAGGHKQHVNRITEPFQHISVVVTATHWDNFFDLRLHPAAQPEIKELARVIQEAMKESRPHGYGGVHLPYITEEEMDKMFDPQLTDEAKEDMLDKLYTVSAARCARVSYLNHDGRVSDQQKDLSLAGRLAKERHMSPFEHQAYASPDEWNDNLLGWKSQRNHMETEHLEDMV